MKTIKTLFAGLIAALAMLMATPAAKAQAVNAEQLKLIVNELQKTLPMTVSEGMTWTKVSVDDDNNLIWTFKITPKDMGMSLSEVKSELSSLSPEELRDMLLGDEFIDVLNTLGCDVIIKFLLPDDSTFSVKIKR